jgi:hypothetical protein
VYRIEIEAEADKALRRLPRNTANLIRSKLLALAADPFARNPNVKKLRGREGYRLRAGALHPRSDQPDHLGADFPSAPVKDGERRCRSLLRVLDRRHDLRSPDERDPEPTSVRSCSVCP